MPTQSSVDVDGQGKMDITLQHNGKEYRGKIGTIYATNLGYLRGDNHLTANLEIRGDWGGVVMGGGYILEHTTQDDQQMGSAYGLDFIMNILKVTQARTWEDIRGKQVVLLYDKLPGNSVLGLGVKGIASLTSPNIFILEEHQEFWQNLAGTIEVHPSIDNFSFSKVSDLLYHFFRGGTHKVPGKSKREAEELSRTAASYLLRGLTHGSH